jgi:hypothetical protein
MRETMPIMGLSYRYAEDIRELRKGGFPFIVSQIPWALIAPHERQAQRNHSQSLETLASRGGLSACEALAVIEDRSYRRIPMAEANEQLARLVLASFPLSQTGGSQADQT